MRATKTAHTAKHRNQRRLPLAPGPPRALGIVAGAGRNIAHINGRQITNINAQFHGGGADQHIQSVSPFAERLFDLAAFLAADLPAVFPGPGRGDAGQRAGVFPAEVVVSQIHFL